MNAGMLFMESQCLSRTPVFGHAMANSFSRTFMAKSSSCRNFCSRSLNREVMSSKCPAGRGYLTQIAARRGVCSSGISQMRSGNLCTGVTVKSLLCTLQSSLQLRSTVSFSSGTWHMAAIPSDSITAETVQALNGFSSAGTSDLNGNVRHRERQPEALSVNQSNRSNLEISKEENEFLRTELGALHLIMGPMFAGKTTALLQRIREEVNAGRKVSLVKSDKDTRYGVGAVVSHDGVQMPCVAVPNLAAFRAHIGEEQYRQTEVIGIDEAQFFEDLFDFCQTAADLDNKTVIVAGLDGDFLRRRFGSALDLVPLADSVTKLQAQCELCGQPAAFTFRKTIDMQTEVIGGADVYMPVCRHHFVSGQMAVETARTVLEVHQASRESVSTPDECAQSKPAYSITS